MSKTWKGRFKKQLDKDADKFNASISFDKKLFEYDVMAGEAHAKALFKAGVIKRAELSKIQKGLKKLLNKAGRIKFDSYEDIHSAVEVELVKIIGDTGKKIHTGRSRNDLVATDVRLYLKDEIAGLKKLMKTLMKVILSMAEKNTATFMPGYTHMQQAQVMSAGHWLMGYYTMMERDYGLLQFADERVNFMPLGSGAFAGSNYPIDRVYVSKLLGFSKPSKNALDAVSDRDFILDFLYFSAITAMHISRFAEEMIIFNSEEFSFIEIDDSFATGSSIMPQKKNPDIPELMRGKAGKFFGSLIAGLTMMKALPVSYNKDLQEDKNLLFGAVDEIKDIVFIAAKFLKNVKFKKGNMVKKVHGSFMYSVDVADYLVKKGVPFRDAHEITGKLVAFCASKGKNISQLTEKELKKISPAFDRGIMKLFDPKKSVNSKKTLGSTSEKEVLKQVKSGKKFLNEN